jgi:hypothetical protein
MIKRFNNLPKSHSRWTPVPTKATLSLEILEDPSKQRRDQGTVERQWTNPKDR